MILPSPSRMLPTAGARLPLLLLLAALACTQAPAGDALSVRPAVTPYLNVPPAPPIPSGGFLVAPAFPNLRFQGAIAVRPVPGTTRLWVIEREGRIWSFENDPATTTKTLVLDLNDDDVDANDATPMAGHLTGAKRWWCQGWDDCGLMGLAFHPEFNQAGSPNRGYFYLGYQAKSTPPDVGANAIFRPDSGQAAANTSNRVARFTMPDHSLAADPASEQILLDQPDPHLWHNGGDLFFGNDGYLYAVNGDGGSAYDVFQNSQRINKGLFSGVFRLDVDWAPGSTRSHAPPARLAGQTALFPGYGIPNDNPFVGMAGVLEEFFAVGLRSPHRMTYDAVSGQIVIGDIGQSLREEITVVTSGSNHQWSYMEGFGNKSTDGSIREERIPPLYVTTAALAAGARTAPLGYTAPVGDPGLMAGMLAPGDTVRFDNQVLQVASLAPYPYASVGFSSGLTEAVASGTPLVRTTGFRVSGATSSTPVNNDLPSGVGTTTIPVSGPGLLALGSSISFRVTNAYGSYQVVAASDNGVATTSITVRPALPSGVSLALGTWVDRLSVLGREQPPVADFYHGGANAFNAIIGGFIYRGTAFPELNGKYIFADNARGTVYQVSGLGGVTASVQLLCGFPDYPVFDASGYRGLSGFGFDQQGELLICRMQANGGAINQATGQLWKLIRNGGTVIGTPIPSDLADTGAFATDAAGKLIMPLQPSAALIPYGVNSPLWSDNAVKSRWVALPNPNGRTSGFDPATEQIGYSPTGALAFPAGTVFVKHFELDDYPGPSHVLKRRKLETRLLVRSPGSGVYGVTYKWDDAGTSAELLSEGLDKTYQITDAAGNVRDQVWSFPSRDDCLSCHNANTNHVLGVNSRQLNGAYPAGSGNQLATWSHIGMFANPPADSAIPGLPRLVAVTDGSASHEVRVRSWIDANCSHCHRPGGVHAEFDARFDTPLAQQGLINGVVNNPLGVANATVVAPGSLTRSLLYVRDNSLAPGTKMPPLAKNMVDTAAMNEMAAWITSLGSGINQAPGVSAGADLAVTLPATAALHGLASDDGLPVGSLLTRTWSLVSGPANVAFANANAADTSATFTIPGTYTLRLTASDGTLATSDDMQVMVDPALTRVLAINAGGAASGVFAADAGATSGWTATTTTAIVTSGVVTPAPQAVYQSERFGNFSYVFAGLAASTSYTVRLHFAETFWTTPGKRIFNVAVNGLQALSNVDIVALTGGAFIAMTRDVATTSDPAGGITIEFTSLLDYAKVSGIEILGMSAIGNAAPAVSAGADLAVTLPAAATLDATVSDDGRPVGNPLTTTWTRVSGPGTVVFGNAAAVDTSATFTQSGTYVLRLTASDGALSTSDDVQVVVSPVSTGGTALRVNAGGPAAGAFTADAGAAGGGFATVANAITTTGVLNPAPQAVYQSERYGNFTYTFTGLAPGSANTVRLHFAEIYWTAAGKRVFNVAINGTPVLAGFDTFAAAGGTFIAVVREFPATSSATGTMTIAFTTVTDNASVCGIEVIGGGGATNAPPNANAGPDLAITLPAAAVLDATVGDDGLPSGTLVTTWSTLSGPATATFANANAVDTTASFPASGTYVLRLTASDGALTASDDVQVVVAPASAVNAAPLVNAGADLAIALPAGAVLDATVSDDGRPTGGTLTTSWSTVSGPGAATFINSNAVDTTAFLPTSGTYVLRLTADDGALSSSDDVTVTVSPASATGQILRELWTGVAGTEVAQLTALASYPNQPSGSDLLTSFEIPINALDDYGTRVRGFVVAPVSGAYRFWISGDDNCQLFLSTSSSPAGRVLIASVPGWTASREWAKYPEQQSALITLVAGTRYYIEALHKEGGGGDNMAVGWQLPDGTLERPLPGNRLMPFPVGQFLPPQVALTAPADGARFTAPATFALTATASDSDGQVAQVEFLQAGAVIATLTAPPWTLTRSALPAGYYDFAARATDNDGQATTSATRAVAVINADLTGLIQREWWSGIGGTSVADLLAASGYPMTPTGTAMAALFEAPINWADNYGTRMSGFVVAPATGPYVFWIAGDDNCQLWLSSNDTAASKVLIASVPGWTSSREWGKYPAQQSAPITLSAGARYYIEALHKEGGGGDSLAVGWQLPSGVQERPIPGSRLMLPVVAVASLPVGWSVRTR